MMSVSDFLSLLLMTIYMQIVFVNNYGNMSNQKMRFNFKFFLIIVFTSVLVIFNNYYCIISLRFITGILINVLTAKIIYNNKITLTIFYSTVHAIFCIILELLASPILLFNTENIYIFNNEFIFKIVFSIVLGTITIFIYRNKKIINFIEKLKLVISNKKIISILLIIIIGFMNLFLLARGLEMKNIYTIFVTLEFSYFLFIGAKIIVNDKYNITILNERSKSIKDSFKAFSKTIDDCRELKHNLRNDLLTIKSGLNKESQNKINEIIIKYNNNYEWINKIDDIPEGLQGLIYLKQKESENKKIKLYVNSLKNIKANNKDYIDLCSILGILIDNAIDASITSKSKIVEINFKEVGNDLNIRISNKFNNNIDMNKIGNRNYSTKEYKSGLGLNFVKKINNQKIKVNFKIVNNLFITDILYSLKI